MKINEQSIYVLLLLFKNMYAYGQRLNHCKIYEVKLVKDEWLFNMFILKLLLCYNFMHILEKNQ